MNYTEMEDDWNHSVEHHFPDPHYTAQFRSNIVRAIYKLPPAERQREFDRLLAEREASRSIHNPGGLSKTAWGTFFQKGGPE